MTCGPSGTSGGRPQRPPGEPRATERRCARVGRRLAAAHESEPYTALAAAKFHKWRWVPVLKEGFERERDLAKARHQEIKARVDERAARRKAHEVDRQQSAELVTGRAARIGDPQQRREAEREVEERRLRTRAGRRLSDLLNLGREPQQDDDDLTQGR